jgi:hypothetical protein
MCKSVIVGEGAIVRDYRGIEKMGIMSKVCKINNSMCD